jgi:hypothetical protein
MIIQFFPGIYHGMYLEVHEYDVNPTENVSQTMHRIDAGLLHWTQGQPLMRSVFTIDTENGQVNLDPHKTWEEQGIGPGRVVYRKRTGLVSHPAAA